MALSAGSVSVDDDGNAGGEGLALKLYLADVEAAESSLTPEASDAIAADPSIVAVPRQMLAARAQSQAEAFVAATKTATLTIPAATWDAGSPSVERVVDGAIS